MKLIGQHTMVLGLKGSGKSNWVQHALTQPRYSGHVMYDVCREHDVLNQYLPEYRRGDRAISEFDEMVTKLIVDAPRSKRPDLLGIEEASRVAPNRGKQSEALLELIDLNRHYGVGIVAVARRPAQVHTDLIELADQLVVFRLTGTNDRRRLNREAEGLGDAAADLEDYHYILVDADRSYSVHEPVDEMDTTGRL